MARAERKLHGPVVQRTGFDDAGDPTAGMVPVSKIDPLPVTQGRDSEAIIACLSALVDRADLILEQLTTITGLDNNG